MPVRTVERKLTTILAADVAGYSRLMGADEVGTLQRLTACRVIVDGLIAAHRGRIFNTAGDSVVADFASAVDAVECAVAVQEALAGENVNQPAATQMQFRIGVHIGDVIVQGDNLLGDGVNITARLEALAEPGGICVSGAVHDQIGTKVPVSFVELADPQMKNIAQPVRTYRVEGKATVTDRTTVAPPLALPDKPSIAVLPFHNMSGDREQEYFVDGMVEEIITTLSRIRWLFVIARNSSFSYKGQSPDVRRVGRELGVRYVLEGSVRKAADRVRITAQLIDASTGAHLWADRFDGSLEDVFDLQDNVASSVAGVIEPRLRQSEIERAIRKPTENLDAYDLYLRALAQLRKNTEEGTHEASVLAKRALEIDPLYLPAASLVAHCRSNQRLRGWGPITDADAAEALRLAKHTIESGNDDPDGLSYAGWAVAVLAGERTLGLRAIDRAVALNPNSSLALGYKGVVESYSNRPAAAIEAARRAIRLSPLDAWHLFEASMALAYLISARYEEAIESAETALTKNPRAVHVLGIKAVACFSLGRILEARECIRRFCDMRPGSTVANLEESMRTVLTPEVLAIYIEGMRNAGLPEE